MDGIRSKIIEPFKIAGNWNVQSKKLKEAFPQLTDEDLKHEAGKEVELLTRLETRLEKNRAEVISIIRKSEPHTFTAVV